jgi:hypothetical protein
VERGAYHQLHDDKGHRPLGGEQFGLARIIDRHDVGVVDLGGSLGFAQQPGAALAAQVGFGQDLDRHVPPEQRVVAAVDDPHAAPADLGLEAVALAQEHADLCRHQVPVMAMVPNGTRQWPNRRSSGVASCQRSM